jgi:hypothetical protein
MFAALYANGAPERIRTADPQIRSLVLYPAELRAQMPLHGMSQRTRGIAIASSIHWQVSVAVASRQRGLRRRDRNPGAPNDRLD